MSERRLFVTAAPASGLGRRTRLAIIWLFVAVLVAGAWLAPPTPQPQAYHAFADNRTLLGVANALDVLSNLAFLVVGLAGLYFVLIGSRSRRPAPFLDVADSRAWTVVFAATALTCCGSGYYHLAPDDARLAWDRLPMALGFMAIVAAVVTERIGPAAGRRSLVPLLLIGAASVFYWRWSASAGIENLNPYIVVQFGSVLVILLVMALFPSRYTRGTDFFVAAALYALAKVAEHFDRQIFDVLGGVVSGHSLKHLLAAAAMYWLLRMLMKRRPLRVENRASGAKN